MSKRYKEESKRLVKESRDNLLTFLIRIKSDSNWSEWAFDHRDDEIQEGELERIIKKAEALKEKEETE